MNMTVHCPACGSPLDIPVVVDAAQVIGYSTVEFMLRKVSVPHRCPDPTRDRFEPSSPTSAAMHHFSNAMKAGGFYSDDFKTMEEEE